MNRFLPFLFAALLAAMMVFALPRALGQDKKVTAPVDTQIEALKKENEALRKENQELRKILIDRMLITPATTNAPAVQSPAGERAPSVAPSARTPGHPLAYWMSSTGKRHNQGCRYYGTGKGHSCGPAEGVACKICGG